MAMPKMVVLTPFKVKVDEALYLLNNTPPQFVNSPTVLELEAGESYLYVLGPTEDFENNSVLMTWSVSESYNWIDFTNRTTENEVELEIVFSFFPRIL